MIIRGIRTKAGIPILLALHDEGVAPLDPLIELAAYTADGYMDWAGSQASRHQLAHAILGSLMSASSVVQFLTKDFARECVSMIRDDSFALAGEDVLCWCVMRLAQHAGIIAGYKPWNHGRHEEGNGHAG